MVYVDEREDSIDDGYYAINMDRARLGIGQFPGKFP
jgi:hypothetical protein